MALTITVGTDVYPMGPATLGELRAIKRHYGVTDLDDGLKASDADAIAALVYLAVKRANPAWEEQRVINYVDDIDAIQIKSDEAAPAPLDDAPAGV